MTNGKWSFSKGFLQVSGNIKFSSSAPTADAARPPGSWSHARLDRLGLVSTIDWSIVASLALLIVLGFGLRFSQLSAIGFAEDEMNKLDAIHAYQRGNFAVNSEHPMVMKLLMWASLRGFPAVSEEAAIRLPNVLIGALTVIPLFLLTAAFFDRWHALLAAAFWAAGINAITHNRIGKDVVRFLLLPARKTDLSRRYGWASAPLCGECRLVWFNDRLEILSSLSRTKYALPSQLSRSQGSWQGARWTHSGVVLSHDCRCLFGRQSGGVTA